MVGHQHEIVDQEIVLPPIVVQRLEESSGLGKVAKVGVAFVSGGGDKERAIELHGAPGLKPNHKSLERRAEARLFHGT